MSMSQFNKWMRDQGVTKGPRGYVIPCVGTASAVKESGPAEEGRSMRLRVTISTRGRDRHGDVLEPGGAQVAAFLRNPVVLWAHESRALPIGRATALVREGEALKAEVVFAETPFAREVYGLYERGFLNGWSVGFLPLEWEVLEDGTGRFAGYHVRSWELVELSAVPVPANPEALTEVLEKGLVSEPALRKSLEAVALRGAAGGLVRAADVPPRASGGRDKPGDEAAKPAEMSPAGLATLLAPKLLMRLRPSVGESVSREISRRRGRLD